uniref:Uncharacterized protein LOC102804642 n=1 Tax=Saccoglossus kowalevskii TaxID=10224 RepID=A0ABM0LVY4_SACKO|nr:PREDICTED: uncharacterized protein LOC102804642 [Saccoglossus kowalevskii]
MGELFQGAAKSSTTEQKTPPSGEDRRGTAGKVFGKILLNWIRDPLEKKLCENQGGFRSGRGCVDMIFSLRLFMEKCLEYQLPALAVFVDFKAAFYSVHKPSMWHILQDYGVPDKYIRLIQCVYRDCQASVIVDG